MTSPYWTNLDECWWLLAPDGGCLAISTELAATFHANGSTVMYGDYPSCKAVALGRAEPETAVAEKPKRQQRKPRRPAVIPENLFAEVAA